MATENVRDTDVKTRRQLAISLVVVGSSVVGVLGLGILVATAIKGDHKEFSQAAQLVLTSILPLVGTWIVTVLAFYFAKENLEPALSQAILAWATVAPSATLADAKVAMETTDWLTNVEIGQRSKA